MTIDKRCPFNQGYDAGCEGLSLAANPFEMNSTSNFEWRQGWFAARPQN